jgi:hypothetical protein
MRKGQESINFSRAEQSYMNRNQVEFEVSLPLFPAQPPRHRRRGAGFPLEAAVKNFLYSHKNPATPIEIFEGVVASGYQFSALPNLQFRGFSIYLGKHKDRYKYDPANNTYSLKDK